MNPLVDTNVAISALIRNGIPRRVIDGTTGFLLLYPIRVAKHPAGVVVHSHTVQRIQLLIRFSHVCLR